MANFKQHLSFGFITTGVLVAPLIAAGYVSATQGTLLWLCGAIGSIIPDVDSDNATALDLVFLMLSLSSIYLLLHYFAERLSGLGIITIVIAGLSGCFTVRALFERLSVHRGVFHSVLAALFFGLATCVLTYHIHHVSPLVAWLAGSFMTIGALTHLMLDELFSVDFMNVSIKRSFGSAFKLISLKHWEASLALLFPSLVLFWLTPTFSPFIHTFGYSQTYSYLLRAMMH